MYTDFKIYRICPKSKLNDLVPPKQAACKARQVTGNMMGGLGKPTISASIALVLLLNTLHYVISQISLNTRLKKRFSMQIIQTYTPINTSIDDEVKQLCEDIGIAKVAAGISLRSQWRIDCY